MERNTQARWVTRLNPEYQQSKLERNTQARWVTRLNPEYLQSKLERNTQARWTTILKRFANRQTDPRGQTFPRPNFKVAESMGAGIIRAHECE
ncbi:hypothetical protein EVAR_14422_1 [Eumeta japonica]|uniref:Uncharacterized protein n=1 Tax=Eumeta variegata TaxID=151549 RepID=A0A4C1TX90_EUMVA|nr:hypothetical protein EVAR_14422_1 [Eumeta japonica]